MIYHIYSATSVNEKTVLTHVADVDSRAASVEIRRKIVELSSGKSKAIPIMYAENGKISIGIHLR